MSFAETLLEGQRQLLREAGLRRQQALDRIPPDARLWMAVAPGWTASLAQKVGFPAGSQDITRTLDDMVAQGLCTTMSVLGPPVRDPTSGRMRPGSIERRYIMDQETCQRIAGEVKRDPKRGVTAVRRAIAEAGRAVLKLGTLDSPTADPVAKWATLASLAEQPFQMGSQLHAAVNKALQADQLADAVSWIEAARPLERVLAEEISDAVRLAGLRVQLRQRRADDERYLTRFFERREQIEIFTELVRGPETRWALHYAGIGGLGKTVLMRHLQTHVAATYQASTARIDFDHLNPEYPSTKPALLLLELAEELRLHDEKGPAGSYFMSFSQSALSFHEGLTATNQPDRSALELIRDPRFQLLLNTFASAAKELPQPVILILDTCEELSKMLPDGTTPGAVAATFEILEALHRQLPQLRVIFAGRRPLASSGAGGWSTREEYGLRRQPRPYLRLHEIRGFSRTDAERYLAGQAECPEHLIRAILPHCVEQGHVSLFTWATAPEARDAETRYNPFELALYGTWAREDPFLTATAIASTDVDQYVKVRIVGRISNAAVLKLLPALAWLGRFDFAAVAALSGFAADSTTARALFEEIASQEWIDRQYARFLEIERGLRPRLLAHFRANDAAATEAARKACAAYLERLTVERPFSELDVSAFEAMLRVVAADPEQAARWWEAVEGRVQSSGDYAWIREVTTRLLAEDNWPETVTARPHIRAAIRATHAAALIHAREHYELDAIWAAAEQDAERYPTEAGARRLRLRASSGRGVLPDLAPGDMDEQPAATLIGSLERHIDSPVEKSYPPEALLTLVHVIREQGYAAELQAFISLLTGRALLSAGRGSEAVALLKDALTLRVALGRTTQRWLDWLAPEDLPSRIAFEFLLWAYPAVLGPRECLPWFDTSPEPGSLDADRFAAALLLLKGAERPPGEVPRKTIQQSLALGLSTINTRMVPHQLCPPLYVVAAQEMALRGSISPALELLQGQSGDAESSSVAYDEVLASDRASMQIFRRFRLRDQGYLAKDSVLSSEAPNDRLLCAALSALGFGPDDGPFRRLRASDIDFRDEIAAEKHARWSTVGLRLPQPEMELGEAIKWAALAFADFASTPEAEFFELSCALDAIEARMITLALGQTVPGGLTHDLPNVVSWQQRHPTQPIQALTLRLRAAALGGESLLLTPADMPKRTTETNSILELIQRVGPRRAATIALEEGELLALRLPAQSISLLRVAHALFTDCGDYLQAWIARVCEALALLRETLFRPRYFPLDPTTLPRLQAATVACGDTLWPQIDGLVEEGKAITDRWLRPWLLRAATYVAFARDQKVPERRTERVAGDWGDGGFLPNEVPEAFFNVQQSYPQTAASIFPVNGNETSLSPDSGSSHWPAPSQRYLSFAGTKKRAGGSIFERATIEVTRLNTDGTQTVPLYHVSVQTPEADAPYRVIREALRPRLIGLMGDEPSRRDLQLLVDPLSAWVPWEAILAGPEGRDPLSPDGTTGAWSSVDPLFVRWSDPALALRRQRRRPERLTAYTLTINHAGADLGGSVWNFVPWTYAQAPRELVAHQDPGDAQILHVVADPIETRAGVRLRLSDQGFTGGPEPQPQLSSQSTERGLLARSEEILKLLPNIEFCVLQLPLASGRPRTGVDREKAGLLRSFAAELHAAGLPAVITLPALSFEDAQMVLQEFADAGKQIQATGSLTGLVGATRRAWHALFARLDGNEDLVESVFDVCLYGGD